MPVTESSSYQPAKFRVEHAKQKSQRQHKTQVTPHAGPLVQMGGRQVIARAPQRSQCHTRTVSGSRTATTRERDEDIPCPARRLSQPARPRCRPGSRVRTASGAAARDSLLWPGWSNTVLPHLYQTTAARVSISQQHDFQVVLWIIHRKI